MVSTAASLITGVAGSYRKRIGATLSNSRQMGGNRSYAACGDMRACRSTVSLLAMRETVRRALRSSDFRIDASGDIQYEAAHAVLGGGCHRMI